MKTKMYCFRLPTALKQRILDLIPPPVTITGFIIEAIMLKLHHEEIKQMKRVENSERKEVREKAEKNHIPTEIAKD